MKKIISIILTIMLVVSPVTIFAGDIKMDDIYKDGQIIDINVDENDGKIYSITLEHEDYYELIQFYYDDEGLRHEYEEKLYLGKNFVEGE